MEEPGHKPGMLVFRAVLPNHRCFAGLFKKLDRIAAFCVLMSFQRCLLFISYFSALSRGDPLPVKDRMEMPTATQKTDTGLTQGLLKVLHKQVWGGRGLWPQAAGLCFPYRSLCIDDRAGHTPAMYFKPPEVPEILLSLPRIVKVDSRKKYVVSGRSFSSFNSPK